MLHNISVTITFFVLSLFLNSSSAMNEQLITVESLYKKSDVVALIEITDGEILEINGEPCGARYLANINKLFKGDYSIPMLNFGRAIGVEVGTEYLVFLENEKSVDHYFKETGLHKFEKLNRKLRKMISCRGIIPGFLIKETGIYSLDKGVLNILDTNIIFSNKIEADNQGNADKESVIEYISKIK